MKVFTPTMGGVKAIGVFILCIMSLFAHAQQSEVYFNYGASTDAYNSNLRSDFTTGQPAVGEYYGKKFSGGFGFWSQFFLPPKKPIVVASEGDYEDRILLQWKMDPLSPQASLGYKIYRDGAYLKTVDANVNEVIDFNVIPGVFYEYSIKGLNEFGEGYLAKAVGFLNPNGVVTGQVTTNNNNPVKDVVVTLDPTIGTALAFDGVDDHVTIDYHPELPTTEFTVSAWIKIGDTFYYDGIIDNGRERKENWWILTNSDREHEKGVTVGIGDKNDNYYEVKLHFKEDENDPTDPDGWNHVALTYNGYDFAVYINGKLRGTNTGEVKVGNNPIVLGTREGKSRFFNGMLDEVRIYNRQLSQVEVIKTMHITVPAKTDGLVSYYKMDEGIGSKIFDLTENEMVGLFEGGIQFTKDKAPVQNAGLTDESGFYVIEGVNYGGGKTFTARPSKIFAFNYGLEFNAMNNEYAELQHFALPDTATIELWAQAFDLSGKQVLLAKSEDFALFLEDKMLKLKYANETQEIKSIGALATGANEYHHYAFVLKQGAGATDIGVYIDGDSVATKTFNSTIDWSNSSKWLLGQQNSANYFSGIIDEVVVFETARTAADIQKDMVGVKPTDRDLLAFFALNESEGTLLNNISINDLDTLNDDHRGIGTVYGAKWTDMVANPNTQPHEFNPPSRIVTLNPSNTAVDGADFKDVSTISVSGVVRYEGTDCVVEGAEILVNGSMATPPIETNKDGEFIADFEPGQSFTLSAKLGNHEFDPKNKYIHRLTVPKAGVVFQDMTKRDLKVSVLGGDEKLPTIQEGQKVTINLDSKGTDCFSTQMVISGSNATEVTFKDLPPLEYEVSIGANSDVILYKYFEPLGGKTVSLVDSSQTVEFIYYSAPQVEIAFDTTGLVNPIGDVNLNQGQMYPIKIQMYEQYLDAKSFLSAYELTINDNISDRGEEVVKVTEASENGFEYEINPGIPNISSFIKTLSVVGKTPKGRQSQDELNVVVLGRRPNEQTFTTAGPSEPFLILRDPGGDGSYSYFEEETSTCTEKSYSYVKKHANGTEEHISLGPTWDVTVGVGVQTTTTSEVIADTDLSFDWTRTRVNDTTTANCYTLRKTYSTSDDDIIVGGEGDVFIGGAMNYKFGSDDNLTFDADSMKYVLNRVPTINEDGFKTTFMYSEYTIRNSVIPNLIESGKADEVAQWEKILEDNEKAKAEATYLHKDEYLLPEILDPLKQSKKESDGFKNISFGSGITYEESITITADTTYSSSFEKEFDFDLLQTFGFKVNNIGGSASYKLNVHKSESRDKSSTESKGVTTGFVLSDDDPGDIFSIDIRKDNRGFLVFSTVSGTSSCPYEEGTRPRDDVSLSVDKNAAINVSANAAAVFTLTLGNQSQTQEQRTYYLSAVNESNPDGAVLKVNGQSITEMPFEIEPNSSHEVTLTVERGPVAYEYKDLQIALHTECDQDRLMALAPEKEEWFKEIVSLDVSFIEPCSEIDLAYPLQDWVVTPTTGDTLDIVLSDYNTEDTDLELVRVQYRSIGGSGAWFNILELPKDSLQAVQTNLRWDVSRLVDGPYEIRAITQCIGDQTPGISTVIKGTLERRPPEVLGLPQPADDVLSAGEEIKVAFTENINCDKIIEADELGLNNIGMYFVETGELIDIDITCIDNQLVIVPAISNQFIENQKVRVKLTGIQDMAGNAMTEIVTWEFLVDRNPLKWVGGDINQTKFEGETITISRTIKNNGGNVEAFTLENVPAWIVPSTLSGQISAGGTAYIDFVLVDQMASGLYKDTLYVSSPMGDEPLIFDLRVMCSPPDWSVDASRYNNTMTVTSEVIIDGVKSADTFDKVAAYVGDELRGVADVQYIAGLNKHMVFLTVYSNETTEEKLSFRIWDASECKEYGSVEEVYTFKPNKLIGSPGAPATLTVADVVVQSIPLKKGWNWTSLNLSFADNSLDYLLKGLSDDPNGFIKDQSDFSYATGSGWAGSLNKLTSETMYQVKLSSPDTLWLVGQPQTLASLPVVKGWNWLPYLPQTGMEVNKALKSLTPLNGDIIKDQTSFAQYVEGYGWIGSLKYMAPHKGYLLYVSNAGALNYPEVLSSGERFNFSVAQASKAKYSVDANKFEHTMTLTATVNDKSLKIAPEDYLVAKYKDETRGVVESKYIDFKDKHLFFMTVYGNNLEEELSFMLYDASEERFIPLQEKLIFKSNSSHGEVLKPFEFSANLKAVVDNNKAASGLIKSYHPNPFKDKLNMLISIEDEVKTHIQVINMLGKVVYNEQVDQNHKGDYDFTWRGQGLSGNKVATGTYFVKVISGSRTEIVKVVYIQ